MSDQSEQSQGGYEPIDPWAPPEEKTSLDKQRRRSDPGLQSPAPGRQSPSPDGSVHNQPTVIGMPDGGPAAVPPPPPAPAAPLGHYGYPAYPGAPGPGAPTPSPAPPYSGAPGYGYPAYPGYPGYGQLDPQQGGKDGMGTAALVLGIISSVLFCLIGVDIIIGVLALIFGIIGRGRARRGTASNGGMALAGIILGAVGVVFATAALIFVIWANGQDEDNHDSTTRYPTFDTSLVVGPR